MKIPQRRLLVTETHSALLESIQSGAWKTHIPGERTLCERFLVSRPTLRQALKQLEQEGIISNKHGQRRQILKLPSKGKKPEVETTTIGFLCPTHTKEMLGYTSRKIAAIEHHIHQNQLNFDLLVRPGCFTRSPAKALSKLIEETQIQHWILQQTNREMQLWFQKNQIPAVITGTKFEGVDLPYVDLDNEATCRHAVGLMIARNRKSIYFLTATDPQPGDLLSETGFMQGIKNRKDVRGRIARCRLTQRAINYKLDAIFESSTKPDAFIVDKTSQAFCTLTYLLKNGYKVPEDFALICRTESSEFQFTQPSIAHYSRNTEELAKRTAELAIKLTRGEMVENKGTLIIPDFVSGQSL